LRFLYGRSSHHQVEACSTNAPLRLPSRDKACANPPGTKGCFDHYRRLQQRRSSIERALQRLGADSQCTTSRECISNAEALLLPGVGHIAALVRALDEQNLRSPLIDAIHRGVPFLGICLGLQVLYESSEEAPQLQGLHLLPGRISALPSNVKLPHMGWNQAAVKRESRLLQAFSEAILLFRSFVRRLVSE
jgi:imidazole glycerol phosphate synthase glutamine amidotransferase subunit